MRCPLARQGWSGCKYLDAAILLSIACECAAGVDSARLRRGNDAFKTAQEGLLVALDLDDQVIAGLAGNPECFFGSAWRRA